MTGSATINETSTMLWGEPRGDVNTKDNQERFP